MSTLSEIIGQGRSQLDELMIPPFHREQLLQTLDAIDARVTPVREKVSEALTILRAPELASRQAIATVAASDLLVEAMALLNGEQEPESGS